MRTLRIIVLAYLAAAVPLPAQVRSGGNSTTSQIPNPPSAGIGDLSLPQSILISGKVVISDGSEVSEPVAIQTVCRGQKHTETYTDTRGRFTFTFSNRDSNNYIDFGDAESIAGRTSRRGNMPSLQECDLQASLPGFSSEPVHLGLRARESGSVDIGRVVIHRLAPVEGLTISATSLMAPESARKALEKGKKQEEKEHWDDAQKSFQKAVQIYPRYAAAWFELGWVQLRKEDFAPARASFEQSLAADSKYVNPYLGLMHCALHEQNWPGVVEFTDKLLALDPVSHLDAWFYNGVGKYQARNFDAAEKSLREGLKLDSEHRIPKFDYVLGLALMQKRNFPDAAGHMRAFLKFTSEPKEIAEAQKLLAELDQLIAHAQAPTGVHGDENEKKK
jgi:tetratricopeptide (TPR) repeat protein